MLIPRDVIDFFSSYSAFYIIGHKEPDGDCLGSQIGLSNLLMKLNKKNRLYSPGPFIRPEVMEYENMFSTEVPNPEENAALVVLDCSTPERLNHFSPLLDAMPVLVIDHHAAGKSFGDVKWIEPSVPAVTLMIHALFEHYSLEPDTEARKALLLGLATDTGFFRHLEKDSSWVFLSAASLINNQATPKEIYKKMYGNRTFNSRVLLGRIFSRLERHFDGRLLSSFETLEDKRELGSDSRDSDLLYSILFGTKDIEALFIIREEDEETISVGLRSLSYVDVAEIANFFGGGGHKNAAGFSSKKPREITHSELIKQFSYQFDH